MSLKLSDKIARFEPQNGSWLELERLFEEAFSSSDPTLYYTAIFNLFERFPNEDGAGVFWSAVHRMEAIGDYEQQLLRFFRRFPSEMTKIMLRRLENAGEKEISGIPLDILVGKSQ